MQIQEVDRGVGRCVGLLNAHAIMCGVGVEDYRCCRMRGFVDAGEQEAGRIGFVAPEVVQHDLAAGAVPEAEAAEQVEAPVPVLEAGR